MSDWQACFTMTKHKTYRVRYVRIWEDIVREGVFHFHGEVHDGNRAIVVIDPEATGDAAIPGPINILEIEELLPGARFDVKAARGEIA
jgi:hypothetical protein